jgi:hypothetical protein
VLQLPQSQSRAHRPSTNVVKAKRKSTATTPSSLDRTIAEHKIAARLARNRDIAEQKILALFPQLAEPSGHSSLPYAEYRRQRRNTGVEKIALSAYAARMEEKRALKRFIETVPQSSADTARYFRYLILAITNEVGGSFNPDVGSGEIMKMGGLEVYGERQTEAFYLLNRAARALARRPR